MSKKKFDQNLYNACEAGDLSVVFTLITEATKRTVFFKKKKTKNLQFLKFF